MTFAPSARRVALAFALALATHGSTGCYADASFAPHCGVEGPFKLLRLGDGEVLEGLTQVGDRYYVQVDEPSDVYSGKTTFSVGLCGEDPRFLINAPLGPVFTLPAWPDQPLGCSEPILLAFDPLGEREPELALQQGCPHVVAASGLVVTSVNYSEPSQGSLTYYAYDVGDRPAFLPGVDLGDISIDVEGGTESVVAFGDEILYIDLASHELVSLRLDDLSAVTLASDARGFVATETHLLVQRSTTVILLDRLSGTESFVDTVASACLSLDQRAAIVAYRDESGLFCRHDGGVVVDLERGLRFEVPDWREPLGLLDDGRWLLMTASGRALSVDLERGEERLITDAIDEPRGGLRLDDDGIVAQKFPERRGVPVVFVPRDGSPAEVLARRSGETFERIADGRVVTVVEESDLVVVERGTLREHLIETDVWGFPFRPTTFEVEPGLIVYAVNHGERRGIYLADLSAP